MITVPKPMMPSFQVRSASGKQSLKSSHLSQVTVQWVQSSVLIQGAMCYNSSRFIRDPAVLRTKGDKVVTQDHNGRDRNKVSGA